MKAFIFDLDGTLLNTLEDLANASNYMLQNLSFPIHDVNSYKYRVGNGIPKLISRSLPQTAQTDETLNKAAALFNAYYSAHKTDCTVSYNGIDELLRSLKQKGAKLAVATNKEQGFARELVNMYFPDTFDYVSGMTVNSSPKPDPDIVLHILDKLCLKPKDTIYLGDSGVDMLTANNAGLYACGVLWGFRQADELWENGAKMLIHTPSDILQLL